MKNIYSILISLASVFSLIATQDRPNFVIFIGDDISAADFGCYGHPSIKTKNVDALAQKGLRFNNAYLSAPSCSPSRTSIITGRYPHNTGGPELHMSKNPHLKNLPQFPHELRKAGYYSALAGKAHFNGDFENAFDHVYEPYDSENSEDLSGTVHWIKAIEKRPKNQPFIMWLAAIDAHRDWDMDLSEGPHSPDDVILPPYLVDTPRTRIDMAHYYNEVHRFDRRIGEVVDVLKEQGVYDNTVFIVMADNGRPFPRDKRWIYDGGIKAPLIIHWAKKIVDQTISDSFVSSIDIAPTLLEIAGVSIPDTVQGVSFLPLIDNPDGTIRNVVFAERNWHVYRAHDRLVRYGDFTYIRNNTPKLIGFKKPQQIHNRPEKITGKTASADLIEGYWNGTLTKVQKFVVQSSFPEEVLYNVENDPYQIHNLANNPEYSKILKRMRALLDQWTDETGDTVPDLDKMTKDRNHRITGEKVQKKGRPDGGEFPGQATKAWKINAKGPVIIE